MIEIDKFILKWYKCEKEDLLKKFGLKNLEEVRGSNILKGYIPTKEGIIFAASNNLDLSIKRDAIIIGGPCISDCSESITLEAVIEVYNLISVAKILNLPAIIYISTEEEIIRDRYSETSRRKWIEVSKRFKKLIERACKNLNYFTIRAVVSSENKVNSLINEEIHKIFHLLNQEELLLLYNISGIKPSDNTLHHTDPIIHARFIVTYLPSFIEKLINKPIKEVIVCENMQQLKAIRKAGEIEQKLSGSKFIINKIIHLPVPSIDGSKRMYRSPKSLKLYIEEPNEEIITKLMQAPEHIRRFYQSALSEKFNFLTEDYEALVKSLKEYFIVN